MNRNETESEKLERQHGAIANLRLVQEEDEEAQREVVREAARQAIRDHWPEMPEEDRQRVVDGVVGYEAMKFQLSIFRRGWATGHNEERIQLDPETAGPRILIRAYATAEADAVRMRGEALGTDSDGQPRPSLEERMRRYLRPNE